MMLRAIGSGVQLLILSLVVFASIKYALDAQAAGRQTTVLQLPMTPFFWGIVALLAACIPVQLIVSVNMVSRALGEGKRSVSRVGITFTVLMIVLIAISIAIYTVLNHFEVILSQHAILISIASFGLLWVLILCFIPLSTAMILCGLLGSAAVLGFDRAFSVVSSETIGLITNADLAVIPLFLMMGGFATVGGLASDIYRFGNAIWGWARGGLAMATIAGSAGFGAFTGSSLATVATIGQAAFPKMRKRGYSVELSVGAIAAGGTLGQLVPPSTAIVIYALLTESSIGALYIAVLLPALITALFYIFAIRIVAWRIFIHGAAGEPFDLGALLDTARGSAAVVFMFVVIIGGIYSGVFTVSEAAAVGAVFAFLVALVRGKLSGGVIWSVAAETTKSTSMIYFIMIGAQILSFESERPG